MQVTDVKMVLRGSTFLFINLELVSFAKVEKRIDVIGNPNILQYKIASSYLVVEVDNVVFDGDVRVQILHLPIITVGTPESTFLILVRFFIIFCLYDIFTFP